MINALASEARAATGEIAVHNVRIVVLQEAPSVGPLLFVLLWSGPVLQPAMACWEAPWIGV